MESIIHNPLFKKSIALLVALIIIAIIIHFVRKAIERYVKDNERRYKIKKIIWFFGFLSIVVVALVTFTDKLGYLSLSIGLFSAAIAFALQEVILSIAGWIYIITGDIYKTGDRIEINTVRGDVIDIGVMNTSIMEMGNWVKSDNYNGRIIKISNSFVFKGPISNYSSDFPFLWDEIVIPIRYNSDYDLVEKILLQVASEVIGEYAKNSRKQWEHLVRKYLVEDATISPTVAWQATDNWIEFSLRYVVDYKRRRLTRSEITKKVLTEFKNVADKVRIASTTLEISNPDLQSLKSTTTKQDHGESE